MKKILFIVRDDCFFISHRIPVAIEAIKQGYEVHLVAKLKGKPGFLEDKGITVHNIELNRKKIGLNLLKEFLEILSVVHKIRPDILHLITVKSVLLGGIAARLLKIPAVVVAISGLGYMFSSYGFLASVRLKVLSFFLYYALNHKNQSVIFQNTSDKSKLENINKNISNNSTIIPGSGVDLDLYSVKKIDVDIPIIMFAARLLASKGVREFIDAAKLVNKNRKNARFVIVGNIDLSSPDSISQKEIIHWEMEGFVELWGYKNNMYDVIPLASVVVLPSYYGEGLPKILIEAAACGRAVVTTDHPGCRDAIVNNKTGLLVPVKDVDAIVKAVKSLIKDSHYCENMGLMGRKLAEEKFDIRQVVKRHMGIYKDLF